MKVNTVSKYVCTPYTFINQSTCLSICSSISVYTFIEILQVYMFMIFFLNLVGLHVYKGLHGNQGNQSIYFTPHYNNGLNYLVPKATMPYPILSRHHTSFVFYKKLYKVSKKKGKTFQSIRLRQQSNLLRDSVCS